MEEASIPDSMELSHIGTKRHIEERPGGAAGPTHAAPRPSPPLLELDYHQTYRDRFGCADGGQQPAADVPVVHDRPIRMPFGRGVDPLVHHLT